MSESFNNLSAIDGVVNPRLTVTVLVGSLMLNLLALAMPLVMLQIFDRVIPYAANATLSLFFFALIGVAGAELMLRIARVVIVGHAGTQYESDLSDAVCRHVLATVPSAHERDGVGVHFERFGAVQQMREHYSGQGRLLIIDLPFTLIFVGLIWLIGGWLVFVPLGILIVILAATLLLKRRQSHAFENRKLVDGRRYSFLIEFLSQIGTAKSNHMEPQMLRRYEMLNGQSVLASRDIISLAGLSQSLAAVLGQASVAAMGLFGAFLVVQGQIGVGELAACMLLNGRTTQPLLKLLGVMMQGESTTQARKRLAELADVPIRRLPTHPAQLHGALTLHRLGYRHPKSGKVLFDEVDADFAQGACVSIEGADGGGRGSLLRMIVAEQAPTTGFLRIDGAPPVLHAENRGVGGITLLDQTPTIFRGTILENVTLFGTVKDQQAVMDICEKLGLDAEVRAMPFGYQTVLGQDAGPQSRGMLQVVCLARALALQPKLLLLNNATSAMDTAAADRANALLSERIGAMTILVVSGQTSLRQLAAQKLVLSDRARRDTVAGWDEDRDLDGQTALASQRWTA